MCGSLGALTVQDNLGTGSRRGVNTFLGGLQQRDESLDVCLLFSVAATHREPVALAGTGHAIP